jgi:hypothetical protein
MLQGVSRRKSLAGVNIMRVQFYFYLISISWGFFIYIVSPYKLPNIVHVGAELSVQ